MSDTQEALAGILLIDKESGYTSMDVCAIVRTRLRRGGAPKRVKVGHAGTLDPMATGLLVVLCGKATPLCNVMMGGRKRYIAKVDFAHRSDTDDKEGEIEAVEHVPAVERARFEELLKGFTGKIQQVPPRYSAVSVGGRRAYQMAREGESVELAPREVEVMALAVTEWDWPRVVLDIECGKGTYIRSLARDIGAALGAGGMLTALRRTESSGFRVEDARRIGEVAEVLGRGDLMGVPEGLLKRKA